MVLDLKCVFLQMILLLTHCGPVRRPIIMNPIKQQKKIGLTNVTIWEKQLVSEKNRPILLLFYFLHRVKMLLSKFEANPDSSSSKMRFFSPFVSSCSMDYFREYVIIDFLTNQFVFLNMVTNNMKKKRQTIKTIVIQKE